MLSTPTMDPNVHQLQALDEYIKGNIEKMNELSDLFKEAGKYLSHKSGSIAAYMKYNNIAKNIPVATIKEEVDVVMKSLVDNFAVIMNDVKTSPIKEEIKEVTNEVVVEEIKEVVRKPINYADATKSTPLSTQAPEWSPVVETHNNYDDDKDPYKVCDILEDQINKVKFILDNTLVYTNKDNREFKYKRLDAVRDNQRIIDPYERDSRSITVYDHVNCVAANMLRDICDIFKPYMEHINYVVEKEGACGFVCSIFENPSVNTVYYENLSTGDVYASYLSFVFKYSSNSSNRHAYDVQQDFIEFCKEHSMFPKFYHEHKENDGASSRGIIRFEKLY